MGKILDSLRHPDGQRNGQEKPLDHHAESPMTPAEVTAAAEDEEYLYVEVGGPGKKIDGSPAVLAVPVPARTRPTPPPRVDVPAVSVPSLEPAPGRPATVTVAFEPWIQPLGAASSLPAEIICYHQPDHPASKQYAGLLERLLETMPHGKPPLLFLAGLAPRSGTTTILLNLAFTGCIQQKKRVIVVDANLRQPALAPRLGVSATAGLNEVLAGAAALDAALAQTVYPLLHVLPGKTTPHPGDFLAADALRWLLLRLRERFDLILVDGPHLGDHPELPALLSTCESMFLVLKQDMVDQCDKGQLAKVLARLGGSLKGLIHARLM